MSEDELRDKVRMTAAEAADRIWKVVKEAGDEGLRGWEIEVRAHVKRSQFENGKVQIRDYKVLEEGEAFVNDCGAYVVTTDPARCASSNLQRLRVLDKQMQRLHRSTCAALPQAVVDSEPALRYLDRAEKAMIDRTKDARESGYSPTSKRIREDINGR